MASTARDAAKPLRQLEEVQPAPVEAFDARRLEIQRLVSARVRETADFGSGHFRFTRSLRETVAVAVEHAVAIAHGPGGPVPPLPDGLIAGAREAAAAGLGIETLLRAYFSGFALLSELVLDRLDWDEGDMRLQRSRLSVALEELIAKVAEEYTQEAARQSETSEERRAAQILALLAGRASSLTDIDYDFNAHHLACIFSGADASRAARAFATAAGARSLVVRRGGEVTWTSTCSHRKETFVDVERLASTFVPVDGFVALGEPGAGLAGWRLTHEQARAALSVASQRCEPFVRYAEVAFLAVIVHDHVLAVSLRETYLKPLQDDRDGGETARRTLQAYFAAGRNVSSAAAALGVSRRTVANRLTAIEGKLDRPLNSVLMELEAALLLDQWAQEGVDRGLQPE